MSREIFEACCPNCSSYTILNLDVSKPSKMTFDCPKCTTKSYVSLSLLEKAEEMKDGPIVSDGPVMARLSLDAPGGDKDRKHLIVLKACSSMLPRIKKFSKHPGSMVDALCLQPPIEAFGLRFVRQTDDRIQIYDDKNGLAYQGSFSELSKTWNILLSTVRKVGTGFQASLGISSTAPHGMKPAALVVGKSSDGWFVTLDENEPKSQSSSKEMAAVTGWLGR